jgi:hypothetical protein
MGKKTDQIVQKLSKKHFTQDIKITKSSFQLMEQVGIDNVLDCMFEFQITTEKEWHKFMTMFVAKEVSKSKFRNPKANQLLVDEDTLENLINMAAATFISSIMQKRDVQEKAVEICKSLGLTPEI